MLDDRYSHSCGTWAEPIWIKKCKKEAPIPCCVYSVKKGVKSFLYNQHSCGENLFSMKTKKIPIFQKKQENQILCKILEFYCWSKLGDHLNPLFWVGPQAWTNSFCENFAIKITKLMKNGIPLFMEFGPIKHGLKVSAFSKIIEISITKEN